MGVFKHLIKWRLFRFLFLNIYAFLLLLLSAVFILMPNEAFVWVFKICIALFCTASAVVMLFSWKRKFRKVALLRNRNRKELKPGSFDPYLGTPCGQLIVRAALGELQGTGVYAQMTNEEWKSFKKGLFKFNTVREGGIFD